MVPDFLDVGRHVLMDVKGCAFGVSRYTPARFYKGQKCDAVRARQNELHQQAIHKAKTVDTKYNGWDKIPTCRGRCHRG